MTATHNGASGRLPVPPPRGASASISVLASQIDGNGSPATKTPCRSLVPYAGKEGPPVPLPPGTFVDGVDCSGMTDDPKKIGIAPYLQTQNRKALSPEQLAKVREIQAKTKAEGKAKDQERIAMAKKLGMSPLEMKKAGAKLKSETKAKGKAKVAKSKKAVSAAPKKAKAVGAARKPGELRPGSKTAQIAEMLTRAKGCTTAEVLAATGWPSVSMPQQAKVAGLKLRKEKDGKISRYYGSEA